MPSTNNQTTTTEQPNMATASLKIMPQQMVKIKTKSMTLCPVMNTVPLKMSQLLMKTKHQPSRTAYKAKKGSELQNMATLQGSEARNISAGKHQKIHEPQRSRYGIALKQTSKMIESQEQFRTRRTQNLALNCTSEEINESLYVEPSSQTRKISQGHGRRNHDT